MRLEPMPTVGQPLPTSSGLVVPMADIASAAADLGVANGAGGEAAPARCFPVLLLSAPHIAGFAGPGSTVPSTTSYLGTL